MTWFRYLKGCPWSAPNTAVLGMSHGTDTAGQTQDTPQILYLMAWERLGIPQKELETVTVDREVWADFLILFQLQPPTGKV